MIRAYIQNMAGATTLALGTAIVSLLGFRFQYEEPNTGKEKTIENFFIAGFIISVAFILGSLAGLVIAIIKQVIS